MANGRRAKEAQREETHRLARELVDRVREAIRNGRLLPWRRPWETGISVHRSGSTGQEYRNGNQEVTWLAAMVRGYEGRRWYTREYVEQRRWSLREGSRPTTIVGPDDHFGARHSLAFYFRDYEVYNEDCIDGLPPAPPRADPWDPGIAVSRMVTVLEELGVELRPTDRAAYLPRMDLLEMPLATSFSSQVSWAATALHELVHWTGHASRLDRLDRSSDRKEAEKQYAYEELIAELGSAIATSRLRIPDHRVDDPQHVAYLASWYDMLRDAPYALSEAMDQAIAAVDLLAALAPRGFGARDEELPVLRAGEVPSVIRGGGVWKGDQRRHLPALPPAGPSTPTLPLGSPEVLTRWLTASVEASGGPEPVLAVVGPPGSGAESLTESLWGVLGRGLGQVPEAPGHFQPPVRLERGSGPDALPAFAGLSRPEAEPSPPVLPASTSRALDWLSEDHRRTRPILLAARPPVVTADRPWLHVIDLSPGPLPKVVADALLRKSDRRPWIGAMHHHRATARRLASWGDRLGKNWLDGRRSAARAWRPDPADTAPFAPVVLVVAQAWLDARVRGGEAAEDLARLVDRALRRRETLSATDLIPLDELLELEAPQAEFVVRLNSVGSALRLCPEFTQGPLTLACLLARSLSEDLDQLARQTRPPRPSRGRPRW